MIKLQINMNINIFPYSTHTLNLKQKIKEGLL